MSISIIKPFLEEQKRKLFDQYAINLHTIEEHVGIEETVLAGGYGYRQILELVQNGADAILEGCGLENPSPSTVNRIFVSLHSNFLYVANTGAPFTLEGIEVLLSSHRSKKRGNAIGRFGLGFKSLLRLNGNIDVFSKELGAFRFDPIRTKREICERFCVQEAPGLRLAWPLDHSEPKADQKIHELDWAETIIRVAIEDRDFRLHLESEITNFPQEFLLFLPVSIELLLEGGRESIRKLEVEKKADTVVLTDNGETSNWQVYSKELSIRDPKALNDATHIHARETTPLSWAVSAEDKRLEAGKFWAFFPTKTPTFIPGILNAPWKLNSDRNAVIQGEWNNLLMLEAAEMFAEHISGFSTKTDPGKHLDFFPRQLDSQDALAKPLIDAIWGKLANGHVIPNGNASLQKPAGLYIFPRDEVKLAVTWASIANENALNKIIHPSCLAKLRLSRLKVFSDYLQSTQNNMQSGTSGLRPMAPVNWFNEIGSMEQDKAYALIKLSKDFCKESKPYEWENIRSELRIIPGEDGIVHCPEELMICPKELKIPGKAPVVSWLVTDQELLSILQKTLRVPALDEQYWHQILYRIIKKIGETWEPVEKAKWWADFWKTFQAAPKSVQLNFCKEYLRKLKLHRNDGKWVSPDAVLLPGGLVELADSLNKNALITDLQISQLGSSAELLGIAKNPTLHPFQHSIYDCDHFFEEWLKESREDYKSLHDNGARRGYLDPIETDFYLPSGWKLLPVLKGDPNSNLTVKLLEYLAEPNHQKVKFGHASVSTYPTIMVISPLFGFLCKYGRLSIGQKSINLAVLWARRNCQSIRNISKLSEILSGISEAYIPSQSTSCASEQVTPLWEAVFEFLVTADNVQSTGLSSLWKDMATDGYFPASFPSKGGRVPLSDVFVSTSSYLGKLANELNRVSLTMDLETLEKWIGKGARRLDDSISIEYDEEFTPKTPITEFLDELSPFVATDKRDLACHKQVSGLNMALEGRTQSIRCIMHDGVMLLEKDTFVQPKESDWKQLLNEMQAAGWLSESIDTVIVAIGNQKRKDLVEAIQKTKVLEDKILFATGNSRKPLLEGLGDLANRPFLEECSKLELVKVLLGKWGPATLSILKSTLDDQGLNPPKQWSGPEAIRFVTELGFPYEFSTSQSVKRPNEEIVSGPIHLPPLHDFQKEVVNGVRTLFASKQKRRRAVVSLPTGGGKTRVTVECAVKLALHSNSLQRCVLWVAQSDELCEQAVQAFRQVWINEGDQGTDLRICRMWGGTALPTISDPEKPVVIVASIQTLNSKIGRLEAMKSLPTPGMIIVDECHHGITKSYTNLLRWLNLSYGNVRISEESPPEPMILGLSATPFRVDEQESKRLAGRFDNKWFPSNQEKLHEQLRDRGVLSEAQYQTIDTHEPLTQEENRTLQRILDNESNVEDLFGLERFLDQLNSRLSILSSRNETLISFIQECEERSIILFANSVAHSDEMAARLNLEGIPSASVSGTSSKATRRYFLEKFQSKELRVLCNHSVLTAGFDAPKTDMVLITRQVFSPVRYMQMVGRGLRGKANGGTDKCRIITVMDNLGRFQNRLAYHYCQRYFKS